MSIKFRITKCLAVSALAMLLLGACSKNNIYIDLADPNEENGNGHPSGNDSGNDNGNPSKEGTLVTFSASVEGRNITRAMSAYGQGITKLVVCLPVQYLEHNHRRSYCRRYIHHLLSRRTGRQQRI